MVTNRRNLIFKVSIVINVCVLLYAALHLSGGPGPVPGEWTPISLTGEASELRYLPRESREESRNDSDATAKIYDESTSQKTPSTAPTTNHSASSTAAITVKSVVQQTRYEPANDENFLTLNTLTQLKLLLGCNDHDYFPQTLQRGEFWVLKNYVRANHGPLMCHETITYTTHASYEFLDNVPPLVDRWLAPISLAIHAPGTDFEPTVNSIRYLRDCLGNNSIKDYVTFHIFFAYKHMPPQIADPATFLSKQYDCSIPPPYSEKNITTYRKKNNMLYPVNVGRNIARDAALTHFVLPSDVELYPSPNLIPKFLNMIARNGPPLNERTNPRVFPLTIFEVAANARVPSTKTELLQMLSNKTAIPFHKYVCPSCHNIPQGQQWMNAKETTQLAVFHIGKRQGRHIHWEPIFIGTHQDPYYDERLSWEGKKDKMQQGYVLCVKDYDFMILNNAFLIHKPGIKRYVKEAKRDSIAGRQGSFIRAHIGPELKKLFGSKAGCDI